MAVVNDDPILLSEVRGFTLAQSEEMVDEVRLNRLDGLINRRLMLQEIAVLRIFDTLPGEVAGVRNSYIEEWGEEGLEQRLKEAGINREEFEGLIREGILIRKFIDYKFRRGIIISGEKLRNYFNDEFIPAMQEQGMPRDQIPGLSEVREQIESVLLEREVTNRLEEWITAQRRKSRIEIRY